MVNDGAPLAPAGPLVYRSEVNPFEGYADALERLWSRRGLSMAEVARRSGVGLSTISNWRGKARKEAGILKVGRILEAIGATPEEFLQELAAITRSAQEPEEQQPAEAGTAPSPTTPSSGRGRLVEIFQGETLVKKELIDTLIDQKLKEYWPLLMELKQNAIARARAEEAETERKTEHG